MPAYYPPTVFHFKVDFLNVDGMDSDTEHRFQEVGGLSFEVETEELREGGENRFVYKLPKRVKYPNLVLKRGLLTDKEGALLKWLDEAKSSYFWALPIPPIFKPSDLLVTLMDEAGQPAAIWRVVQAYPVKWSVSEFKATDNAVAVETIELAYQYFERAL